MRKIRRVRDGCPSTINVGECVWQRAWKIKWTGKVKNAGGGHWKIQRVGDECRSIIDVRRISVGGCIWQIAWKIKWTETIINFINVMWKVKILWLTLKFFFFWIFGYSPILCVTHSLPFFKSLHPLSAARSSLYKFFSSFAFACRYSTPLLFTHFAQKIMNFKLLT